MAEKVTRILHSQGLNRDKYDRLARIAVLCGKVRTDAWQRCSGESTAPQSPYDIRDAWMAEGYALHGLPTRPCRAAPADALGDITAVQEAAKVPVKRAVRHRTRGNSTEREWLYTLLKRNCWTEDPFLHTQWQGDQSHVTNQIVVDSDSYTTKVWHGQAWVYLQCLERGQLISIPIKGTYLPSGTLHIILQPNGQVAVHHALDEEQVCSTRHNQLWEVAEKHAAKGNSCKADNIQRNNLGNQKWDRWRMLHHQQVRDHLCQAAHAVADKAGTIACDDLSVPMKSAKYCKDTNRRLHSWGKGVMVLISRRRGSALALVNSAYTSQIAFWIDVKANATGTLPSKTGATRSSSTGETG